MLAGEWLQLQWTQEYGGMSNDYKFIFRDLGFATWKLLAEYFESQNGLDPATLDYLPAESFSVPQTSHAFKKAGKSLSAGCT